MSPVLSYIIYDLRWHDRRGDNRIEGYAPWEVIEALGAVVDLGQLYGVFSDSSCVGYVTTGSASEIVAECNRRGWMAAHVAPAPAVLARCKQHPDFAAFAADLYLDADGRVAGWPDPLV